MFLFTYFEVITSIQVGQTFRKRLANFFERFGHHGTHSATFIKWCRVLHFDNSPSNRTAWGKVFRHSAILAFPSHNVIRLPIGSSSLSKVGAYIPYNANHETSVQADISVCFCITRGVGYRGVVNSLRSKSIS